MPRKKPPDRVIFTDLDGTLLDHDTYSWEPAKPALKMAERNNVPVVFCTSKTRAELEVYRKRIKNKHPFIVENGEAIFIPNGYFSHSIPKSRKLKDYTLVALGKPYRQLRQALLQMQKKGLNVRGFGDMPIKELMERTSLSKEDALLSKKREYDEPFVLEDSKQKDKVIESARKAGLQVTRGGRFHHLLGSNDKGLAVKLLTDLYSREAGRPVVTTGIGDSKNDVPMLNAVHVPYLLKQKKTRKHITSSMMFIKVKDMGPRGWNSAITDFILEEVL